VPCSEKAVGYSTWLRLTSPWFKEFKIRYFVSRHGNSHGRLQLVEFGVFKDFVDKHFLVFFGFIEIWMMPRFLEPNHLFIGRF
jgi:hypothetical protein